MSEVEFKIVKKSNCEEGGIIINEASSANIV